MKAFKRHDRHPHQHGENCGHSRIRHGDHFDYIHDGHLHHQHEGDYYEHIIEISMENPDHCEPQVSCSGHVHGKNCGHEVVPHGDHLCYIVDGRLHHYHNGHCDDHGPVEVIKNSTIEEKGVDLDLLKNNTPTKDTSQKEKND